MESKKISFGFKKVLRPCDIRVAVPSKLAPEEKKDFIECIEENAIKLVGGEAVEDNLPLVIPMKPNTLSIDRYQQIAAEIEASVEEPLEEEKPDIKEEINLKSETLEEQAARELIKEAMNIKTEETKVMTLPLPKEPPLEGQKESSLEDYENIPIADFGMAMLRGMGWTAGQASKYTLPVLRPKGLGLGADKLVKPKKGSSNNDDETEQLDLKKGCYVRVLAGKHSGAYGKVVSLNEEAARATVELTLGHNQMELGEQVLQTVTKEEFEEKSRVLNSNKYDEYKKKEQSNENSSSSKNFPKASSSSKNFPKASPIYKEIEPRDEKKDKKKGNLNLSERAQSDKVNIRDSKECNQRNGSENYNREYKNETARKSRRDSSSVEKDQGRDKSHKNSNRNSSDEDKLRKTKRWDSSSDNDRVRRKNKSKKRENSEESLSSGSSKSDKRKKSKNRDESRRKRDIDKKRKGKKKKRDRYRSPVYRKHKR